jgi:hypothetical protein
MNYDVAPSLVATVGLRYTHEDKQGSYMPRKSAAAPAWPVCLPRRSQN